MSPDRFGFLSQRLLNVPLAIHPRKAEVVRAALWERLGFGEALVAAPVAFFDDDDDDFSRPGRRVRTDYGYDLLDGVAIIPVQGTLVKKLGSVRPYSGMTGYDGIRQAFFTALADGEVDAIYLDIDSPGGEVAGCFDLVDQLYAARGEKPIWAILNENAYSAAYAIASAADRIIVPRTGGTGSIGVIAMRVDLSERLTEEKIKVTYITRGRRKAEGRPETAMTDEELDALQAEIDIMGELFEETVARNRSLSAKSVFDLEAATFLGAEGVKHGLADEVMAPDAAFRALLATLT